MDKIPDLLNISQLEELTGIDRRRISDMLDASSLTHTPGPKNAKLYKLKEALPVLYKSSVNEDEPNTDKLVQERLLLLSAKRKQAELDYAERLGKVVPIEEIADAVGREYTVVRAQLRALPSKLAKHLASTIEPAQVFETLTNAIDEVLSELQADAQALEQSANVAVLEPMIEGPPLEELSE